VQGLASPPQFDGGAGGRQVAGEHGNCFAGADRAIEGRTTSSSVAGQRATISPMVSPDSGGRKVAERRNRRHKAGGQAPPEWKSP
jgi:hypothetical protein